MMIYICVRTYHFFLFQGLQYLPEVRLLHLEILPSDLSYSVWVLCYQCEDLKIN